LLHLLIFQLNSERQVAMTNRKKFSLIVMCGALITPAAILGQTDTGFVKSSLGISIGRSWMGGDWSKSRIAPAVNLFTGGLALEADLEFRLSDRLTLAVIGSYAALDGSDWENYTRSKGDNVSVRASMILAGVMLRPFIKTSKPDLIRVEFGPVALFASGEESFQGRVYAYDFFSSFKIGARGGIEYDRVLSDDIAISVRVAGIFVPSGIEYGDGESRTVIALPVTAGIRFFF
jgi:hypothetical protein